MAFQFASTNLVIELGVLLVVLMGWSFGAAEFVGGPLMIVIMLVLLPPDVAPAHGRDGAPTGRERARGAGWRATPAWRPWPGGQLARAARVRATGWTSISHFFVMNWTMLWKDIVIGLLISGALGALVPGSFWHAAFLTGIRCWSRLWGPVIGPLIAIASFTCSIGNVPLAAVLWNGGISFGGVVAFIFGDLIILPILEHLPEVLRPAHEPLPARHLLRGDGARGARRSRACSGSAGWIPAARHAEIGGAAFSLNYTTVLNLLALVLAGWLYMRYRRTGGPEMMRAMAGGDGGGADGGGHRHHGH